MKTINLYLVDDHELFVTGLVNLLTDKPGFHVCGYAHKAVSFLEELKENYMDIDVFLIDINMPDMSGIDLTKSIIKVKPGAKILALSMYADFHFVQKMIGAGAKGYAIKSANINELLSAIRMVHEGRNYLHEQIKDTVIEALGNKDVFEEMRSTSTKNTLSKREREILSLVAREKTSQQIAEQLFISELTVETHRKNIMIKTNIKSTVGLVKYAIREGYANY